MEVRIDFPSFVEAHGRIEASRDQLAEAKLDVPSRSSRSEAMDEFAKRAKELKKLVGQYKALLENDSWALFQTSTTFADMDSREAAKYAQSMYDGYKQCPVKGSPYYDAYQTGEKLSGGKSSGGFSDGGGGSR